MNDEITADSVRVVDGESGDMLGVMKTSDAIAKAAEKGLDLVEVSPGASPPVCKILDYGKYRYEAQKKAKEAKKNQKIVQTKEIKLRMNTDTHDLDVKMRNARKFIEHGDKVKVSLRFRGREVTHNDIAREHMLEAAEGLSDIAKMEVEPKMEGRQMIMILVPV